MQQFLLYISTILTVYINNSHCICCCFAIAQNSITMHMAPLNGSERFEPVVENSAASIRHQHFRRFKLTYCRVASA